MNIAFWITLGLFVSVTVLYFVFYKLDMEIQKKVMALLICPLMAILSVCSLFNFKPDSLHVILISVIAFLFCSASVILFFYDNDVKFRIIGRTAFLLSAFTWFILYKSTFYIYKTPALLSFISGLVYIAIFVITCILLGKQKIYRYFWAFLSILVCSMLHFCSIVTFFEAHNLYSVFLLAGTTTVYVLDINYLSYYKKEPHKHTKLIQFCMLCGSQLLIATANFLMLN